MRIGLFTDFYLPTVNGLVYMVDTIRTNLENMGHTVYVVAPKTGLRRPSLQANTLWIPALSGVLFEDQLTSIFFPPLQYRTIAKLELEVIMFFTPGQIGLLGAYCALKQDIPLVTQYCTDLTEYVERYPLGLIGVVAIGMAVPFMLRLSVKDLMFIVRNVLSGRGANVSRRQDLVIKLSTILHNHCDAVVAVSSKMYKQLQVWHTQSHITLIPTGVNVIPANQRDTRKFCQRFNIQHDDRVIMYVGRLAREKNLELLIHAFDYIADKEPRAKLFFVGDYMDRKRLEDKADRSPFAERIVFTGRVPREQLGSVYKAADVFAFPSLTDTQALVVNEAAHAGLPFVWMDRDLNAVLVEKETGLRAENNPADFAAKTLVLLKDENFRRQAGKRAQVLAEKYNESVQTEKLYQLFKRLTTAAKQSAQVLIT